MGEELAAEIPPGAHLNIHGVSGKEHHRKRLEQNHRQVHRPIGHDPRQGVLLNKIGYGEPLQERQRHVHRRRESVEGKHTHKAGAVGAEDGA